MEKLPLVPAFEDARGRITDVLQNVTINAVTFITFEPGAVRGNHYHKATTQWNYVVSGRVMIRSWKPDASPVDTVMEKGELVCTPPHERHALLALEPSEMLFFTQGPRGGKEYESDTFRDEEPLIAPKPAGERRREEP